MNNVKHEMAYQPMIDVVPCVGFHVEKITPEEKYYDFGNSEKHYTLNSDELLNEFPVLGAYRTLESSPAFKQAKKIVAMKNMYSTNNQYTQLCANVANSMGLKEKGLSPEQLLEQQIANTLENGKFNDNPNPTGVKASGEYFHNMDSELKKSYMDGTRLTNIKRNMF